tara:strand:- start:3236 stop:3439 length:204 start_codon:yes stop_codon:yes gene_type:complete
MQRQLLYTGVILFLFLILVLGIPLFPSFMAKNIIGPMNLGMLIFFILHILTPLLAYRYLKQVQGEQN